MHGVFAIPVFILLLWALSENRRKMDWRLIVVGIGLQFLLGYTLLKTIPGRWAMGLLNDLFASLSAHANVGARTFFGNLVDMAVPVTSAGEFPSGPTALVAHTGAIVAFSSMPVIVFAFSLTAVLYHLGVLSFAVRIVGRFMQRTMRLTGAESLCMAGNVFLGPIQAPALVRPYLATMTRAQLMTVLTGGLATVDAGAIALYAFQIREVLPDAAGHLMVASAMSAPAAFVCARILVPETEDITTASQAHVVTDRIDANVVDAASRGAVEGIHLVIAIVAIVIAFQGSISLINAILGWGSGALLADGAKPLSLQSILGFVMWPVAWIMGATPQESGVIGNLIGLKTITSEFIAFLDLSREPVYTTLSPHGRIIAVYALAGFTNLGTIGIMLGGIGGLIPERRGEIAKLSLKALLAASVACFMTAAIAGLIV
ncbi:MAG: NupC/NupG family nucleoside CNT transporter [Vicinamibacteria bacterium]|nr:NupC/NupG family nucleoside CNT transporter [Vicinamibacteria bacterium]